MITVISPAKTLDYESQVPTHQITEPVFKKEANQLVEKLEKLSFKKIKDLMSLSDQLAELNVERYKNWHNDPSDDKIKQALFAFKGDVYLGLDAYSLEAKAIDFAQNHLRILSGAYGVLKPLDGIQPYRLEMGTSLNINRKKNLYQYWGTGIATQINKDLENHNSNVLINLASNEYFKAVDRKTLKAEVIAPVFKDFKNGKYKVISFYAKKARGLMSRFILDNQIDQKEDLLAFEAEGYHYNASLSNATEPVFTREME